MMTIRTEKECKHLNSMIRGFDRINYAWCPDCKASVPLSKVFNNLLDAMREAIKKGRIDD